MADQSSGIRDFSATAGLSLSLLTALSCLFYQNRKASSETITAATDSTKNSGLALLPHNNSVLNLASPNSVAPSPKSSFDASSIFANLPPSTDPKVAAAILLRHQRRRGYSEDYSGSQKGESSPSLIYHSSLQPKLHKSRSNERIDKMPSFSKSPSYYELHKLDDSSSGPAGGSGKDGLNNSNHGHSIASASNDGQALATLGLEQPMVIAMVGLPARGKSYLVKMIIRYLKWTGFESQMFNVGSYRRMMGMAAADSHFFDGSNPEFKNIRENLAMAVQDSMYKWLHETIEAKRRVAIFDATNTTRSRRLALAKRARQENVFLLFVESICDDENVLRQNYELKLQNEDYKGMDPDVARKDFMSRVQEYEKVYETIVDDEDNSQISYIKLINVGQKVITRNCYGYLPSQVAFYLQNVHIQPRKIYLSYLAEFVEQALGSENLGGCESGQLTPLGIEYTYNITSYLLYQQEHDLIEKGKEIIILTGTSNIHYHCVAPLKEKNFKCVHTPLLNELRGGDLHGLTKEEIKVLYPEEYEKRQKDKLNYRYPGVGGESYLDVIERVRPVIIELERQRRSIFIICHMAVLRCIYAYFMGVPQEELPFRDFEKHRLYELTPGPFGCSCAIIRPHSAAEDTDRGSLGEEGEASNHSTEAKIIYNPDLLPQSPNIVPVPSSQKLRSLSKEITETK